jgi:hypothetical protein
MRIRRGDEYRGPGQPDPSKPREERRAELRVLARTAAGFDVVSYFFLKCTGGLEGLMPPIGASMIETILDHEYPDG